MQILHWSGISNVQISFRDFVVWLKKKRCGGCALLFQIAPNSESPTSHFSTRVQASLCHLEKKAKRLCAQMKWITNRCCCTWDETTTVVLVDSREQKDPFFKNTHRELSNDRQHREHQGNLSVCIRSTHVWHILECLHFVQSSRWQSRLYQSNSN